MTAIFAPIRGIQTAIDQIVMLDTQMTDLRRVMDATPSTYNSLLQESIALSSELGNRVQDVNNAMVEFARQGWDESTLMDLTGTATIASNISELTTTDAMSTLTAAMEAFNIEASDSISIIDRLNEVDNNFAIDTASLSAALNKSAATANTFGVTMDELVGQIAAIGITTRESGQVVGNSLKTIYTRLTTMQPAIDALASVGISVKDSVGQMRSVTDILGDLGEQWSSLTAEQQQNLGVTLAGRFQVSRFLTLMQQWDTAIKVTNTSLQSQGSAMREQVEYSKSLEARLNRLSNAGVSLAQSLGDAVLTDGLISTVEAIERLASSSEDVIDTVGFLAPTLGAAGVAAGLFSGKIRGIATDIIFAETQQKRMIATTRVLSATWKGFVASTGIGLAFAAAGFALEKLISAISDNIQKQEEFRENNEQSIKSMSKEKETIDQLVQSYEELSRIPEADRNVEQEEKYVSVQNELAQLLPSVKIGENEKGDAILANSTIVKDHIGLLEQQLEAQQRLVLAKAPTTIQDNRSALQDTKDEIAEIEEELQKFQKRQVELAEEGKTSDLVDSVVQMNTEKLNERYAEQSERINEMQQAYRALAQAQDGLSSSDADWIAQQAVDANMAQRDFDLLIGKVIDLKQKLGEGLTLDGIDTTDQLNALQNVANEIQNGSDDWSSFKTTLRVAGVEAGDVSNILGGLRNSQDDLARSAREADASVENSIPTYNEFGEIVGWTAGQVAGESGVLDENTDATYDNADSKWANVQASEILFGVTSDQIKQAQQAVQIISLLSQVENLSAQQKEMLAGATEFLANMYPHLSGNIAENIGWISSEITAMADLNDASGYNATLMMSNQDSLTKSTVDSVNQRIRALNKEAQALKNSITNYENAELAKDGTIANSGFYTFLRNRMTAVESELASAYSTRRDVMYNNYIPDDYKSSIPNSPRYSSGGSKGSSGSRGNSEAEKAQREAERAAEEALKKREEMAEEYVDILKDAYEKRIELLEAERDKELELLDEKAQAYSDYVDEKINQMDREREASEYKNEEEELRQEQLKLQRDVEIASLNNSQAGIARRIELEKELAEVTKQLNEFRDERSFEMQKQALEDQEKIYQEQVNAKKESIQSQYDSQIGNLEETLNNEKYFSDLRLQVTNNFTKYYKSAIKEQLDFFEKYNKDVVKSMESNWNNLISLMNKANNAYKGSVNPSDLTGSVNKYHDGGIVGDKPNSRLAELANKLFNTKPNEQVIKSLVGELQVPPQNIPNIFKTMSGLMNVSPATAGVTDNSIHLSVNYQGGATKKEAETFGKFVMNHIKQRGG